MNRILRFLLLLSIVGVLCHSISTIPIRAADSTYVLTIHITAGTHDIADMPVTLTHTDVIMDARTDVSGRVVFKVPAALQGQDVRVSTSSRVWQLPDNTQISVDNRDIVQLSVTRIPVIFVPGLLGSFIERDECSLWLGVSVNALASANCSVLPDKRALNDISDTRIRATDAVRLFQVEVPDYIYVVQLIEQLTSIDILGLIDIPILKMLLGIPDMQAMSAEEQMLQRAQMPDPMTLLAAFERILLNPNMSVAEMMTLLNVPSRKVIDENISYRRLFDSLTTGGTMPLQEVTYPLTVKTPQERCLETQAYVAQNPDEFRAKSTFYVFAYDWRQSSVQNADTLANYIECVRTTHGGGKVNLVGHSLGGLVIQQYLRQNDAAVVNRVATINTPYFGVVRMLEINGVGEFEPIMMLLQLNPTELLTVAPLLFATTQGNSIASTETIAQIDAQYPEIGQMMRDRVRLASQSWPSSKELFPSDDYLQHNGAFWSNEGKWLDVDDAYWNEVATQFNVNVTAEDRERMRLIGNDRTEAMVARTTHIDYLILYNSNPDSTVTSATKLQNIWSYNYAAGDGTVSELSLKRRSLWGDWNPARVRGQREVVVYGYCNKPMIIGGIPQQQKIDHASIISHDDVAVQLNKFFAQERVVNQSNECVDGYDYSIDGVIEHTTDSWNEFKDWVIELWDTYVP